MADKISFAEVQLKPGVTAATSPNAITASDTGGTTDAANRALVAIAGDGDRSLEVGETAYVLGAPARDRGVEGVDALNGADDPVGISTHGRFDADTVGALGLEASLGYWPRGFGVRNGTESSFGTLSRGDSVTWTLNDDDGVAQRLQKVAFTVDRGGSTGAIEVAIDFDGDVVGTGSYAEAQTAANADAALRLDVNGGDVIAIDFDASVLTVNGVARGGAAIAGFFADYAASPKNALTIGTVGARSFTIGDLVIDRTAFGEAPVNTPPGVSLTPLLTSLPENADTATAIKVADIVVTDDGIGTNALGLAGADAPSFEIVGAALFLKAGTALDFETKTSFDVTVTVDDASIGAGPDGAVDFTLAVTDANANRAPVLDAQIADQTVDRGDPVALDITSAFSDPDGDALTYTVAGTLPAGVSFADGVFSGAIDAAATPGAYEVKVTATDVAGSNTGVSDTFVLTVAGGVDTRPTVRIEAEDGTLSGGFSVEKGSRIKTTGSGEATYDLSGVAQGDYLVRIGYWDENDGASSVGVTMSSALAGTFSDTLMLDEATPSGSFTSRNYRETTLDGAFKLGANGLLTLTGLAQGSEIVRIDWIELIPTGAPAGNQAPSVSLANKLAGIPENADTATAIKVADIVVTDDGIGTNALGLAGADAPSFEIVGAALFLKAGTALDFETKTSFDVTVTVDDASIGAGPDGAVDFTLAVTDVAENLAPTAVVLTPVTSSLAENADTGAAIVVATIAVTDDGLGVNALNLSGDDAGLFEIFDNAGVLELRLIADAALDFETNPTLDVTVSVDDVTVGSTPDASADFAVAVTDVAETFGPITLDGSLLDWASETRLDTPASGVPGYAAYGTYQAGAFVFALSTDGVAIGQNTTIWLDTDRDAETGFSVFGAAGAEYNINLGPDGRAALYAGAAGEALVAENLTFAFNAGRNTLELALPSDLMAGSPTKANVYIDVNDGVFLPNSYSSFTYLVGENLAPGVSLTPLLTGLPENADTGAAIEVADIVIADDGIGVNTLSLSGADAAAFEIVGSRLVLKAGAALDFETNPTLDVTVLVDDAAVGSTPDASAVFSLAVTDVDETFGAITLDGVLADWAPDTRLDTVVTGTPGYSAYGTFDTGAFVFAISTSVDDVVIGPNTTIWLDTDLNPATGFQIFGFAGGAEYNITFGNDGRAALYTGGGGLAEGGTLIEDDLPYFFSADRRTVEVAVPSALMEGAPNRANVLIDVNNNAFLPGNFSLSYLVEEKLPLLPQDPAARVAIVYSETSADKYFSKTAYGQLFMAAQSQAMQAGIPFDVIAESDLTDIANLVKYDSLVFPGFANVRSADLAQITATLTSAVEDYRIGLIAMGNFMTNDESGAAIAGNSYARMQALLGVTLDGFGATDGVVLLADTDGHPVSDLYAPGEVVGSYGNNSYQTFTDVTGGGAILFSQTVGTTGGATQEVSAVIVTTTGGRNVHFATDAAFGNNNILSEAINWSVRGDAPDVGLQMTRGTSIFFSRNDMDQSQEIFDVVESEPGIYDEMLPIIEKWFSDYGFVGSYYINIGNEAPDQATNWTVSKPYYDRILALDSEIGSHSYTHPDDTNLLTPAQIQFEFEQSKAVIEAELGITISGAAVPGQPELLPTSLEIIQYYDYLTGGYSSTGAGYPGAFGFLNPANADKVYFAPNVSFDFSLLGFQGLTVSEAEAVWAAEYASITAKGSTPIIHFPWHDYGPTNWETSPGEDTGYTLEMFTNFIERAYLDGTEFVTGKDLAQRIKSFVATDIEIEASGADIVAKVTGSDVGKFALEIDTTQRIASVENWYAYDGNKVFLPKNGGTFTISLGADADDVTRIIALPMRAELLSANGDGTDLAFTYEGRGETKVDLKAWGASSVVVSGAASGALAGEILTLTETAYGRHDVAIDYTGAVQVTGTDGNDFIIGSDESRTIDGGLGDDRMFGGGGEDVFVFRDGGGVDTVLDFDLGLDRISLINSGYTDKTAALEAFVLADDGLTLSYTPEDRLVLAGVEPGELTVDHIILDSLFA